MEVFVKQIALSLRQAIDGYCFSPTDEELINYLKSENPGYREGLCIIPTLGNIYAINPWDLPEKFSEKSIVPSNGREWWFICPLMQNQRNCRKTQSLFSWKITGKSTEVKSDGQTIGSKTIFVFPGIQRPNGSKNYKSLWLIHEYRLPKNDKGKSDRDYVLCHLKPKQDELGLLQTDDAGSLPKLLIQKTKESLRLTRSAQHQNRAQFSLPYLLQLFQCGPQSQNNSSHSNINQVTNIGNLFDAKVQKGEEPRLEKVQQETAARNIGPCMSLYKAEARAKDEIQEKMKLLMENRVQLFLCHLLQLLPHGLQSPNNSSSSTAHHFTNVGNSSGNDFSLDDSLTDKSTELKSSLGTTNEDEWVDAMPDADLSCAKVQRGEEPRLEMVQQETGARNIEDEAAAGAKLLPYGLQSPNNSSSSTTHHFTNVGNSSGKDFSLDDSLTDKSIELKSSLGTANEDGWVDAMPDADLSCAKVQRGEEPRLEMVQQETGARNIEDEAAAGAKVCAKVQRGEEPRLEMVQQETGARNIEDEAAAGAKNGQTSITENRQTKIEPVNLVDPHEEAEDILLSRFSPEFMDFSKFEAFFDEPAAQAKGLEHEDHNLAGNSPKRRRLDVSEENHFQ
ncbi:hypothetical protein ACJRO7_027140 [Eucalyptus globulus]|uniref:NAC domain-containing protein n=1 Tax=Eucalyptus globulus TaxID=34317 RepID=A0ABD3JUY9_EUCGL